MGEMSKNEIVEIISQERHEKNLYIFFFLEMPLRDIHYGLQWQIENVRERETDQFRVIADLMPMSTVYS